MKPRQTCTCTSKGRAWPYASVNSHLSQHAAQHLAILLSLFSHTYPPNNNADVYEQLKEVLNTDSAVAGESAGLAMGLVMLGSANEQVVEDMVTYAHETQHEKIIRGLYSLPIFASLFLSVPVCSYLFPCLYVSMFVSLPALPWVWLCWGRPTSRSWRIWPHTHTRHSTRRASEVRTLSYSLALIQCLCLRVRVRARGRVCVISGALTVVWVRARVCVCVCVRNSIKTNAFGTVVEGTLWFSANTYEFSRQLLTVAHPPKRP